MRFVRRRVAGYMSAGTWLALFALFGVVNAAGPPFMPGPEARWSSTHAVEHAAIGTRASRIVQATTLNTANPSASPSLSPTLSPSAASVATEDTCNDIEVDFVGQSGQFKMVRNNTGEFIKVKLSKLEELDASGSSVNHKISSFASEDFDWVGPSSERDGEVVFFDATVQPKNSDPLVPFGMWTKLYNRSANLSFGPDAVSVSPCDLKFSVNITGWPWYGVSNLLRLTYRIQIPGSASGSSDSGSSITTPDGSEIEYLTTALLDGSYVSDSVVVETSFSGSNMDMALTFSHFNHSVYYDPVVTLGSPTSSPSLHPSVVPTRLPTLGIATPVPTAVPTFAPTVFPTVIPTEPPTPAPTVFPTEALLSEIPTTAPSGQVATPAPSMVPTSAPSVGGTTSPSSATSLSPSASPSSSPTLAPSAASVATEDTCNDIEVDFVGQSGQFKMVRNNTGEFIKVKLSKLEELDASGSSVNHKISSFASEDFDWVGPSSERDGEVVFFDATVQPKNSDPLVPFGMWTKLYNRSANLSFGPDAVSVSPCDLKFSVNITGWPWYGVSNLLRLTYRIQIPGSASGSSDSGSSITTPDGSEIEYLTTALLDGSYVSDSVVVETSFSGSNMDMALTFSHFNHSVYYDPVVTLGAGTVAPSSVPTMVPSLHPTMVPSLRPTMVPSLRPTIVPSLRPTMVPSLLPTMVPSLLPTYLPSTVPTFAPTVLQTGHVEGDMLCTGVTLQQARTQDFRRSFRKSLGTSTDTPWNYIHITDTTASSDSRKSRRLANSVEVAFNMSVPYQNADETLTDLEALQENTTDFVLTLNMELANTSSNASVTGAVLESYEAEGFPTLSPTPLPVDSDDESEDSSSDFLGTTMIVVISAACLAGALLLGAMAWRVMRPGKADLHQPLPLEGIMGDKASAEAELTPIHPSPSTTPV